MAVATLASCDLNFFPSDELNDQVLLSDESGAEYIMDGCYSLLKDEVEFLGYSSGNTFVRHFFQMSEFPADNCNLSSHTTDALYQATALCMTDNLKNVGTLWMVGYKVIYMTNTIIETLVEGESAESDHLLGEAYFVRGWMHLNLATLYARPYSHGRENLGIPLQISTNNAVVTRASVGEVYDQIVKDLTKASELMGASRGNKGYPSKETALGILSRVHLYMENWQECVNTVNAMLGGASAASKLDADLAKLYINAKTSNEVLFCLAHETIGDDMGQSSIGSMYLHSDEEAIGWGEIYPSNPLLYLYERYPMDLRYTAFIYPQYPERKQHFEFKHVYFPDPETENDDSGRLNLVYPALPEGEDFRLLELQYDTIWDPKTQEKNGKPTERKDWKALKNIFGGDSILIVDTIPLDYIAKKIVNGEYFEYHVKYKGEDCLARVHKAMKNRNTSPIYYMSKFSYQDGKAMISSPIISRWGEVILNRAEAYAHLGQDANALEDVNVIRNRAGIPAEGMFATGNMHGYASVLDVVLDERRLELAFEGFRTHDLTRNKINIDRKYPGAQPWQIVPYNHDYLIYPIPNNEWTVSGIQQNPGY